MGARDLIWNRPARYGDRAALPRGVAGRDTHYWAYISPWHGIGLCRPSPEPAALLGVDHGSGGTGNASAAAPRLSRLCPGISSSQPGLSKRARPPDRAARRAARVAGGDGPAMGPYLSRSTPASRRSTRQPSGTRRSAPMSSSSMRRLPASRPRRASIRPPGRNLRTGKSGLRERS